jgi:hypothetical protein
VYELRNKKYLIFVRDIITEMTMLFYLETAGTTGGVPDFSKPFKKFTKPITHFALDESKGLLALYNAQDAMVYIFISFSLNCERKLIKTSF